MRDPRGQVLVGAIVILLIMAIIIPAMVLMVQNEARWSIKQQQNMTAFQLAEAGIDRGVRKISESTVTWTNGQNGSFPTGMKGELSYSDLQGGCYMVTISSGPEQDQVTILSISSETKKKEGRAIQAIYANAPLGDTAVRGNSGVTVGGSNTQVHWGAIITPKNVTMNSRLSPQVWTSGSVDLDGNGSAPPNCDSPDCVQWHSFEPNIPPDPGIDSEAFYNAAVDSGTYYGANQCWGVGSGTDCGVSCTTTCSDATACATGKPYYIAGDLCVKTSGIFVLGTLFVTGDMTLPSGLAGEATRDVTLPRKAWMQYGRNWAAYATGSDNGFPGNLPWDPTAPAAFPGLTSTYKSPAGTLVRLTQVMVEGFLYVGGALTQSGGSGQTKVVGAAYVGGTVTVGANNFFIYYGESAGSYVKTTQIILSRQSWKDVLGTARWPGSLTCP